MSASSADSAPRTVIAGWSRSRIAVDGGPILDVGSGAYPNPAADILCDAEVDDDCHRHGAELVIDRPFVVARVEALPFRAKAFSFVIASHLAEHVADPAGFCREVARVGRAGYIETPSPLADVLLHEDYHVWRVHHRRGVLRFRRKKARSQVLAATTERFYRFFYAGRPDCSRPTWRLPRGWAGRAMAFALKAFGAALARLGVMHTRYAFSQGRPLRFEID